jgi:membrane protease subunit (stomatin/prohibitin family)
MALIDRIKYDASSDEWLVWKYQREDIRLGAQLIVNQSQEALFYKGGQALDVFGPGTHTLSTGNLPLLNKLINLPFGGETPFAAEVWFVNRTAKRDLPWGTRSPIPVIDPVYNFPVNVRAFGQWGIRVEDSRLLVTQLVGTLKDLSSGTIDAYFMGEIVQRLSDSLSRYFSERGVSIFQANAKLNELSQATADAIRAEFKRFGLEIVNFNVERISMPDEDMKKFQEVLGRKMEIDQLSKSQVGAGYTASRTFDVLEKAAGQEGGAAGALLAGGLGLGMGLGAGVPVGQQMGQALTPQPPPAAPPAPAPDDAAARLKKLKGLLDGGLISQEEFDAKRKQILDSI